MQSKDIFIIRPTAEQADVLKAFVKALKIKFEVASTAKPYSQEFVKKILESEKQYKRGEYRIVKTKDLWK